MRMFVSLHELMCSTCMQVPAKQKAPEETVVSCRGGVQSWTQILCNRKEWDISPGHQSNLKSKNLPENITIIELTVYCRVMITKMTAVTQIQRCSKVDHNRAHRCKLTRQRLFICSQCHRTYARVKAYYIMAWTTLKAHLQNNEIRTITITLHKIFQSGSNN